MLVGPGPPGRTQVMVVGLGNRWRGDDGFGPAVLDRLRDSRILALVEPRDDLLALLDAWEGHSEVILVDALRGAGSPGSVHHWDLSAPGPLPPVVSSHQLPLDQVLALARELGRLPPRLELVGVEGQEFALGADLSPSVQASLDRVVGWIKTKSGE